MRIFQKISFDEKYIIHNYEDVEFNIRMKKIYKKIKLLINVKSFAYDKLSKNTKENIESRIYFMTLLYLKNKSFKNFVFYNISLFGFFISCIFSKKIKKFKNIIMILKKANLKANN